MNVTYPKKSHKVGEQHDARFAPATASPEYNQVTSKAAYKAKGHAGPNTRHTSKESARAPYLNGSGTTPTASYGGSGHAKFGSEQTRNVIKSPTSDMPSEA